MIKLSLVAAMAMTLLLGVGSAPADAAPKKSFKLAWTIYAGWMPWPYAADHGIVKKWADKYGITIDVVQVNDYAESINQYTAGAFDALTITNMDTVAVPAVGGVDTTAVIIGDFSNGNDAVILKNKSTLADIRSQKVNLVQYSVSHYLLDRALELNGMKEQDVKVVNTSDADMAAAYKTSDVTAVVTWQPIVAEVLGNADAHEVFDSSKIPGEIMDLAVINSKTLADNPNFAKALTGAWYETLAIMTGNDAAGKAARAEMGKLSGTDLAGFEAQLKTTRLFVKPSEALEFARSVVLPDTSRHVSDFLFAHGLMGDNAKSADVVGISFPTGAIQGNAANIKFRFDDTFMAMAEAGKL
jgi:NitT/TauT family transport system substrate-binding protein